MNRGTVVLNEIPACIPHTLLITAMVVVKRRHAAAPTTCLRPGLSYLLFFLP